MKSEVIHIMAGGPEYLIPPEIFCQKNMVTWIGVDRGVNFLLKHDITPDLAVGDFDSVNSIEMARIMKQALPISRFKPEKDETDMELAIMRAMEKKPRIIKIYGATGGRLDHFLANAFILMPYKQRFPEVHMEIIDRQNTISIFLPGEHEVIKNNKTYISFLPLTEQVQGLTLDGFKYPLDNARVNFGSTLCISNELTQQTGHFSFEKGILLMIRSID